MKNYDHKKIEKKWQDKWEKADAYHAIDDANDPKDYLLIEFPYPSGDGLHVGHVRSWTALDVVARKRRAEGKNVLYPIGWDAFGLPTENYALKTGKDPRIVTKENTDNFRRQIKSLGLSFDWSREINTTDPSYYKWTQWIFLQLYKKGLAYKAKTLINWCPKDKIGLANEEVVDGCCERCGTPVVKREKEQWMMAITKYAQRLYDDLDTVDYIERAKTQQRNWIGPSEGVEIDFPLGSPEKHTYVILHGFTSSPDRPRFLWMKRELEKLGHKVVIPTLPNTENPSEEEQVSAALAAADYDENTIICGFSLGAVVAMKVIEKLEGPIKGLVMAGGFADRNFKDKPRNFDSRFRWEFDADKIRKNAGFIIQLQDTNDHAVSEDQASRLAKMLGIEIQHVVAEKPHFGGDTEPSVLGALVPRITVFTTRPDTLFGATYLVLAPEHAQVKELKPRVTNWAKVEEYINAAKKKNEIERTTENKEKTGVKLEGIVVINPVNGEEIPLFVADYVLGGYGTGAIMAVPAHDERDFAFAKKFNIPIKRVIEPIFRDSSTSPAKPDLPMEKRDAACVVVRNPNDDTYLCIQWKGDAHMHGLVTGGIEAGEDLVDAAKREVTEETGYKNLSLSRDSDFVIHSLFFHRKKLINRWARFRYVFLELENDERNPVDEKEAALHEVVWKRRDELNNFFSVIEGEFILHFIDNPDYINTGEGILVNSGEFDGMDSAEAKPKITEKVGGKIVTTFKLRDWVFSRQRYWGEPIPMTHCDTCGIVPVPEDQLPVMLPQVEKYQPTDTGESPLANITEWVNTKCPKCEGDAKRETDVMPNWAGSSWYYLRYTDPQNAAEFASEDLLKYWTPVDWYNGGMEHTVLHLLYSRFWHKFLFDQGLVPTSEPYMKRTSHGLILAEDGSKMSKSKGNTVSPDAIVENVGADSLRLYEMFLGPFDQPVAWNTNGVVGMRRFLERVASLTVNEDTKLEDKLETLLHQTIRKVSDDIENLKMNTAVSALMILLNECEKTDSLSKEVYETFLKLLAPFVPHLAHELWEQSGKSTELRLEEWPIADESKLKGTIAHIVIQIDGKMRGDIQVPADTEKAIIERSAREAVAKYLEGKTVSRVIVVPNRLVNFVVTD